VSERPPSKNPWLRMSALPRAIGIVCLVVGGVWVLQGIGVAKGSVMTGNAVWAVIGVGVLVVGAIVLRRALNAAKTAIAADEAAAPPADPPVI
jgi:hypothetical protein